MAETFGSGVTRTLSALQRQFGAVVWQKGKPPLDAELNLMGQVDMERMQALVSSMMPSGFLLDPTRAQNDFHTDPSWSNFFRLGRPASDETEPVIWAAVNGWLIPVAGTSVESEGDMQNRVRLNPPPATDTRIDLVFLEVWACNVAPNPSTSNKPSATTVYKFGNVEYGGTNITDDIEDPETGFETTERLQIQYRIRVMGQGAGLGASVALDEYPDGLDDPNVLGQGTATAPVAGMVFTNMRVAMGDPGLWRAGDGDSANNLGTYDGYVYAVPIAAVFRRNANPFVAVESSGNANQNGAFDRNPSAAELTNPRDGAKVLTTATLTNAIDEDDVGTIQVDNLTGSGFDDTGLTLSSVFVVIDSEVIGISAVDTSTSPATITIPTGGRGRNATMAVPHAAGATLSFFNTRPDGRYADEIADKDILDLRRGVNAGDWDYHRLLIHNLTQLVRGDLRASFKQSASGDTQGPVVVEVDSLLATGTVPNQTEALDGPDGIRTIWSDAAALQPDVTVMLDDEATQVSGSVTSFDANIEWDVGADFKPGGFMTGTSGFQNCDVIFLHIGGDTGSAGARATFRDGTTRGVRFVAPQEYWKTDSDTVVGRQHPVTLRFIEEGSMIRAAPGEVAAQHPGPMYPLKANNFEYPFIFLGGVLNSASQVSAVELFYNSPSAGEYEIRLPGLDFDTDGAWYSKTAGVFDNDASEVTQSVLRGQRTLYSMLTQDGRDSTGNSSEVYLVVWGDDTNQFNNGVFKVIGAGATAGYTDKAASAADRVRVTPLRPTGAAAGFTATGATLTGELRSQYTNSDDGSGFTAGLAAACVVITDIEGTQGGTTNPWNATTLGSMAISEPVASKMVLNTTLQYHPGRGGMARVPDNLWRVSVVAGGSEYVRNAPSSVDTTFPAASGVPDDEIFFEPVHISVWNRLRGLGLSGPDAPDYGGQIVAYREQDREAECFVDKGSKTLLFRPILARDMTLHSRTLAGSASLFEDDEYPGPNPAASTPKDGAGIFTANQSMGFLVPPEHMPRFGRQDIPYHVDTTGDGSGTFLAGINHLFLDSTDATKPVFYVIGGKDNTSGGNEVNPMYFQTGTSSGLDYGEYSTITIPAADDVPAYQGRLMSDTSVISSDLGRGLEGIELPPHLGIARLYGVYDRRDFVAQGGSTFESDRVTVAASPATNLLRTDATKQTLFIRQGGAEDVTNDAGDHTYVIPSNAIDITLSPTYVDGEKFDDLEYVVECVVFGFARGFINENNYVLSRLHNGQGTTLVEGTDYELEGCGMAIHAAAPLNDQVYVGYDRTVYQGDPYMTRAGNTRTNSDYEHRYGQIAVTDAYELRKAIQQFDSTGATTVQTVNDRPLQVLAALDFYTTLGTGKIGGEVFAGTVTDTGYVHKNASFETAPGVPAASTTPEQRVLTRAFTEGQRNNTSHASLRLRIEDNASLTNSVVTIRSGTTTVTLTEGTDYSAGADATASATAMVTAIGALSTLTRIVTAKSDETAAVTFTAVPVGAEGNSISVEIDTPDAFTIDVPAEDDSVGTVTKANLAGGVDLIVNAGDGTTRLDLTGMTERLPLGILLQDFDFCCESPLSDNSSAFRTSPPGIQPVQSLLPLTENGGEEYTRFLGAPGQWIGMTDGEILKYTAYDATTDPTGSRRFRLFRGGGSAYILTDPNPGGPVDWVSGSFPKTNDPVLKGAILVCKALLVRNFVETAFATEDTPTHGDELQMVLMTYGIFGNDSVSANGISLSGIVSPTGYGEGYAAVDRYRLEGKPMMAGELRSPPTTSITLAEFPLTITSNPTG